jgi:hypothetical protein
MVGDKTVDKINRRPNIVLVLGSAPQATETQNWLRDPFSKIVAINNSWRVRPDWDYLIHPEDFDADRCPDTVTPGQQIIEAAAYVPAQNQYGGFVYAGGTMAFTAGYWALAALKPDVIAFFGCDMVYPTDTKTHFYGTGAPDPLRADISLRNLEAKSARMMLMGARDGCAMVNLSTNPSRLILPTARATALTALSLSQPFVDLAAIAELEAEEARIGYVVPSGRYWQVEDQFDPQIIDALDARWLAAAGDATAQARAISRAG